MVQKWAPLVWLAPGEKFFPSEVPKFLRYMTARSKNAEYSSLPVGPKSEEMYLVTKSNIGKILIALFKFSLSNLVKKKFVIKKNWNGKQVDSNFLLFLFSKIRGKLKKEHLLNKSF